MIDLGCGRYGKPGVYGSLGKIPNWLEDAM